MDRKTFNKYQSTLLEASKPVTIDEKKVKTLLAEREIIDENVMAGFRGAQVKGFGTEGTEVDGNWIGKLGVSVGALTRSIVDMFRKGIPKPDPNLIDPNKDLSKLVRDILTSQKIWERMFQKIFDQIDPNLGVASTIRDLNRTMSVVHSYLLRVTKGVSQNVFLALGKSDNRDMVAQMYSQGMERNAKVNESYKEELAISAMDQLLGIHEKLSELIADYKENMPRNMKDLRTLAVALEEFYDKLSTEWIDQNVANKIEALSNEMQTNIKNQINNVKQMQNLLNKKGLSKNDYPDLLNALNGKETDNEKAVEFLKELPYNGKSSEAWKDFIFYISKTQPNLRKVANEILNGGAKFSEKPSKAQANMDSIRNEKVKKAVINLTPEQAQQYLNDLNQNNSQGN